MDGWSLLDVVDLEGMMPSGICLVEGLVAWTYSPYNLHSAWRLEKGGQNISTWEVVWRP